MQEELRPTAGTHSTNKYKPSGHFLYDHQLEKYAALGVEQGNKCIKPGINDMLTQHPNGWWNYLCSRKSCPRHWRRSAGRFWRKYKKRLPAHAHITHIRLTTKIRLTKRERGIERWCEKVLNAYPGCFLLLVVHRGKKCDHWHAMLGTDQPPDLEQLRHFWKRHQPGKRHHPWHCSHAMAKPHNNAKKLLSYFLYGRDGNTLPPWGNIKCKSPISLKS